MTMTRVKTIVLAFIAVCSLSAVASATALAGTHEFVNGSGGVVSGTFTGTSGVTTLETATAVITCKTDAASGSMTSTTEGNQTVTFKECKTGTGQSCKNETAGTAGTLEVALKLKTVLNEGKTATLLLLEIEKAAVKSQNASGEFKFECSTTKDIVRKSFLTPVGTEQEGVLKHEYAFTATKKSPGVQNPTKYFNDATEKVEEDTLEAKLAGSATVVSASEEGTEKLTLASGVEGKFV